MKKYLKLTIHLGLYLIISAFGEKFRVAQTLPEWLLHTTLY